MKTARHIGVGFLVSFVGSLPLGYLNVAGLQVYASGMGRLVWYLIGVITVEAVVIYLTLIFARSLVRKQRLLKGIEACSVIFMFILAAIFFSSALHGRETVGVSVDDIGMYPAYMLGLGLSCFNFLQLPFWTGWNLYLLEKKHIRTDGFLKFAYVFGTAVGTFCGMLVFILVLAKLDSALSSGYLMHVIAAAFAIIGIIQAWKFYRKYYTFKKP